ncbi:hypothetical protein SLEP1_g49173 [Rubroshorea leprosula]|uniref:Uncharacterized protein n=2 Tax=Rubroshorea leprosula TaxID=152421 RepID=A0AAV5LY82_9ROSI|nr:hypothetical protein SLEP1_g49173 [Rubroshorea leprosula]
MNHDLVFGDFMISERILRFDLQILMVSECDMISSEPCALVGPVSRVYGVCRASDLGSGA